MKDAIYRVPYTYRVMMQPNPGPSYYTQVTNVFYIRSDRKPYYLDLFKIATRIIASRQRKITEGKADQVFVFEPGVLQAGDFQPETILVYDDEIENDL